MGPSLTSCEWDFGSFISVAVYRPCNGDVSDCFIRAGAKGVLRIGPGTQERLAVRKVAKTFSAHPGAHMLLEMSDPPCGHSHVASLSQWNMSGSGRYHFWTQHLRANTWLFSSPFPSSVTLEATMLRWWEHWMKGAWISGSPGRRPQMIHIRFFMSKILIFAEPSYQMSPDLPVTVS